MTAADGEPMSETVRPLVALIGATASAIPPATAAFSSGFPEATIWNLLDDRLIVEALDAGGLTPSLRGRMSNLIRHAIDAGADGVLLTCSMYGPVAHELAESAEVPVLASDDAAFNAIVAESYRDVALVSSRPVPLADARERLDTFLAAAGVRLSVTDILAAEALGPSSSGDADALASALASAISEACPAPDAVLLAQYSLAPAASRLSELVNRPVVAGPIRAASAMRDAIGHRR